MKFLLKLPHFWILITTMIVGIGVISMNITAQIKACRVYYPEVETFWCVWGNYGAPPRGMEHK